MADPLRTDGFRAHADDASVADGASKDAKIEQLLLVGLDHYFAGRYELAINVWTRALFLDRSHARARAYIERARSAQAEGQRESEELLQNGVAAFHRGESDEARRLLQAAIHGGAQSDEALALLDRLNRLETTVQPAPKPRLGRARRDAVPSESPPSRRSLGRVLAIATVTVLALASAIAAFSGVAVWRDFIAMTSRIEPSPTAVSAPVARDASLPLPRRGETALLRARTLLAGGHLRDALVTLEGVRSTDPQQPDADRLRADIQRQLLALTPVPSGDAPEREKGERRTP